MSYEINVAKDGVHLFATHQRSMLSRNDYVKVMKVFRVKFPVSEGYTVVGTSLLISQEYVNDDGIVIE